MSTVDKVKIGLDECRMLGLGAQVLIGFQFQAVFQPRFDALPTSSKVGQIVGLLLLLASLGMLIVPSTQHILVERLQATRRIEGVITRCLDAALLPLALALALDITIQIRSTAGALAGALCGGVILVMALGAEMAAELQIAHAAALLLVALAVLLLMLPAAYHRIVFAGEDAKDVLRVGTRTVTLATLPLSAAMALDASVVCAHALHATTAAAALGLVIFCALVGAWLVFPLAVRLQRGA